jgi:hypothetical protein
VLQTDTRIVGLNVLISRSADADDIRVDYAITGDCNSGYPLLECSDQDPHRITNKGTR